MGVLRVDSSASTDRLIVTGDILALLENRRAARFLKDNTDYTLDGDTIVITGGVTGKSGTTNLIKVETI